MNAYMLQGFFFQVFLDSFPGIYPGEILCIKEG
jgi:hypothetical protein